MIFHKIIVEDFGIYAGQHEIKLAPPSKDKPVVLIGGMNGGGKTTLLDAIQLALYGQFAQCSTRGSLGYSKFLGRCINHKSTDRQARITVEFTQIEAGKQSTYSVTRRWSDHKERVHETLTVEKNGHIDKQLSNQWTEAVEAIMPRRIANLFLFDGEQIESYASPVASQELIKSAIHSLLGMDIVDKLDNDLEILTRQKIKHQSQSEPIYMGEEAQLDDVNHRLLSLKQTKASTQTKIDAANKSLFQVNLEFEQKGGEIYLRKRDIEEELESLQIKIAEAKQIMVDLAGDILPLILVDELLVSVRAQTIVEKESEIAEQFLHIIEERDKQTLELMANQAVDDGVLSQLATIFGQDNSQRKQKIGLERLFNLNSETVDDVALLLNKLIPSSKSNLARILDDLNELQALRSNKLAELASVPSTNVIDDILDRRQRVTNDLAELENALSVTQKDLASEEFLAERISSRIAIKREQLLKLEFENQDNKRIIAYAEKARKTLSNFKISAIQGNLDRIENLILQCFNALHRKQHEIDNVSIDPETFAISLTNKDGYEVKTERLSAGERQLFAIATLWGLAKASNRQLPTVIDTPLGRLDSSHRKNLVDLYFPNASHQVILLSTDEEISGQYLKQLEPSIGSRYELQFGPDFGGTRIVRGYFNGANSHAN